MMNITRPTTRRSHGAASTVDPSPPPPIPTKTVAERNGADTGDAVDRTSLCDLPAEIWSKIGKLTIDVETTITQTELVVWMSHKPGNPRMHQPGITRACRILREELWHGWTSDDFGMSLHDIGRANRRNIQQAWVHDWRAKEDQLEELAHQTWDVPFEMVLDQAGDGLGQVSDQRWRIKFL
ncbi:uncharacterized protein CLAFUR5_12559 [Fulvia fulva]|uniref:Uncharacterized protein n=1 Tax=Passalora fulva TaxID=5499 RepID=A0A9Q8PJD0_PASFU|nr:uncharacterized protein CLAFUR5_12559 [Fulvia fulva]KAK4612741.1 hypothetical protein CLAFUR0_12705 [Fulvia fulva]UJO23548.1 hypothetical protein CLAFUR5_12559 [Fulvia fulva]WPV36111.1 hypothetical protein CLAFUW7_12701 [Fulvia fulva]